MAKTYVNTVKYLIHEEFEIKGIVDKPDIIGAVFGQSEGLLGEELDLRELQKNGRIGRIEINHTTSVGATKGEILIPSSMDMVETSILAAAIETVDKVGPCEANFFTRQIEDTRKIKRNEIKKRAQTLLRKLMNTQLPDSQELAEEVRKSVRAAEVQTYGPEKIACGPGIEDFEEIVLVEGRADVLNLLKYNIKNIIAMGGSKIPVSIVNLTKKKNVTVFIDGDRGGLLNLRKIEQLGEIDFVARAPDGKEVEELTLKEILMALRRKVPFSQFTGRTSSGSIARTSLRRDNSKSNSRDDSKSEYRKSTENSERPVRNSSFRRSSTRVSERTLARRTLFKGKEDSQESEITKAELSKFEPIIKELKGSLKAKLFNSKMELTDSFSVRELLKVLPDKKKGYALVFDGIVTRRVIDEAKNSGIKYVVGVKKGKIPEEKDIRVLTISA